MDLYLQYHAILADNKVGPFPTRQEALDTFRVVYQDVTFHPKDKIMTGYGSDGPWFNIIFHPVKEDK